MRAPVCRDTRRSARKGRTATGCHPRGTHAAKMDSARPSAKKGEHAEGRERRIVAS